MRTEKIKQIIVIATINPTDFSLGQIKNFIFESIFVQKLFCDFQVAMDQRRAILCLLLIVAVVSIVAGKVQYKVRTMN